MKCNRKFIKLDFRLSTSIGTWRCITRRQGAYPPSFAPRLHPRRSSAIDAANWRLQRGFIAVGLPPALPRKALSERSKSRMSGALLRAVDSIQAHWLQAASSHSLRHALKRTCLGLYEAAMSDDPETASVGWIGPCVGIMMCIFSTDSFFIFA